MEHDLKTWPIFFQEIWDHKKTFEIRRDDRVRQDGRIGFMVGDLLHLREWDPQDQRYTGRVICARVTYMPPPGSIPGMLAPGFVIMAIKVESLSRPADKSKLSASLAGEREVTIDIEGGLRACRQAIRKGLAVSPSQLEPMFGVAADEQEEGWEVHDAEIQTVCYAPTRDLAKFVANALNVLPDDFAVNS